MGCVSAQPYLGDNPSFLVGLRVNKIDDVLTYNLVLSRVNFQTINPKSLCCGHVAFCTLSYKYAYDEVDEFQYLVYQELQLNIEFFLLCYNRLPRDIGKECYIL